MFLRVNPLNLCHPCSIYHSFPSNSFTFVRINLNDLKANSETEENYLKAIFHLEGQEEAVGTNMLAKFLSTSPASVTDMLKKLAEKMLVNYQPYQGVNLTSKGRETALKIVRKHRLWEVFLVNVLHFSWDQVHATAEQLEHVESPELIQKLDAFLGFPKFDPHGDPIPNEEGLLAERLAIPLDQIPIGSTATMAGVLTHNDDFLRFLDKLGLKLGTEITVKDSISFDHSLIIVVAEKEIVLSGEVARMTLVLLKNEA
jgi:DtxR family transcriptional regulator, Mn-dependent transcriptional regulator